MGVKALIIWCIFLVIYNKPSTSQSISLEIYTAGKDQGFYNKWYTAKLYLNGDDTTNLLDEPDGGARGHNIAVFDEMSGEFMHSTRFDTCNCTDNDPIYNDKAAEEYLNNITINAIVAVLVWDTGESCVKTHNTLMSWGCNTTKPLFRESFIALLAANEVYNPSWQICKKRYGDYIHETDVVIPLQSTINPTKHPTKYPSTQPSTQPSTTSNPTYAPAFVDESSAPTLYPTFTATTNNRSSNITQQTTFTTLETASTVDTTNRPSSNITQNSSNPQITTETQNNNDSEALSTIDYGNISTQYYRNTTMNIDIQSPRDDDDILNNQNFGTLLLIILLIVITVALCGIVSTIIAFAYLHRKKKLRSVIKRMASNSSVESNPNPLELIPSAHYKQRNYTNDIDITPGSFDVTPGENPLENAGEIGEVEELAVMEGIQGNHAFVNAAVNDEEIVDQNDETNDGKTTKFTGTKTLLG